MESDDATSLAPSPGNNDPITNDRANSPSTTEQPPANTQSINDSDGDEDISDVESTVEILDNDQGQLEQSAPPEVPRLPRQTRRLIERRMDKRMKAHVEPLNRQSSEQLRSSSRKAAKPERYTHAVVPTMDINAARQKYPTRYKEALEKELQQFHDKCVAEPIDTPVSGLKHTKIIGVKGFFKETFHLETGELEKLKFRLVPQGHLIDRAGYSFDETTSPTVHLESVFASINVAAYENRRGFTMDIPGAYLNALLQDPHMIRFTGSLAQEYLKMFPKYKAHAQADGSLLMLVKKAFYGLPESSALWFKELSSFLKELGYVTHPCDKGIFTKSTSSGDNIMLLVWVDDILGWSTNDNLIRELEQKIVSKYGHSRLSTKDVLHYIGMTITQPKNNTVKVCQREYLKK